MSLLGQITDTLRQLPDSAQSEVLDFVEFLKAKAKANGELRGPAFSIDQAMVGMDGSLPFIPKTI